MNPSLWFPCDSCKDQGVHKSFLFIWGPLAFRPKIPQLIQVRTALGAVLVWLLLFFCRWGLICFNNPRCFFTHSIWEGLSQNGLFFFAKKGQHTVSFKKFRGNRALVGWFLFWGFSRHFVSGAPGSKRRADCFSLRRRSSLPTETDAQNARSGDLQIAEAKLGENTWLLLGSIFHLYLLWFSEKSPLNC